ncbi:hypothetical protein LTR28_001227, partial [Elasticomyces elasticus]
EEEEEEEEEDTRPPRRKRKCTRADESEEEEAADERPRRRKRAAAAAPVEPVRPRGRCGGFGQCFGPAAYFAEREARDDGDAAAAAAGAAAFDPAGFGTVSDAFVPVGAAEWAWMGMW